MITLDGRYSTPTQERQQREWPPLPSKDQADQGVVGDEIQGYSQASVGSRVADDRTSEEWAAVWRVGDPILLDNPTMQATIRRVMAEGTATREAAGAEAAQAAAMEGTVGAGERPQG